MHFAMQIKSGDDEATMMYGRTELSDVDAESEEDKQHLKVATLIGACGSPL